MKPLPTAQWDPSLQHIIDDMGGRPINLHCLLANHPALLKAWWNYRMYSVNGGDLAPRETEIVILRVAVRMRAWYEWAAHVDRGLSAGLSVQEIERVVAGPEADDWNNADRALLLCVDTLISERCLQTKQRNELEQHFSEQQVMDIIWLQGLYVTIATVVATWPIEIEDAVLRRLPEEFTEAGFRKLLATNHH